MSNKQLRIQDVDRDKNGVFSIVVGSPETGDFTLIIEESEARGLLQFLQASLLGGSPDPLSFPTLTVTDARVAEGSKADAVLLQTLEVGSVALLISPSVAETMKGEIDRCVASDKSRRSRH